VELARVRIQGSASATRRQSPVTGHGEVGKRSWKPAILAMSETEWERSEGLSVIATKGDDRAKTCAWPSTFESENVRE